MLNICTGLYVRDDVRESTVKKHVYTAGNFILKYLVFQSVFLRKKHLNASCLFNDMAADSVLGSADVCVLFSSHGLYKHLTPTHLRCTGDNGITAQDQIMHLVLTLNPNHKKSSSVWTPMGIEPQLPPGVSQTVVPCIPLTNICLPEYHQYDHSLKTAAEAYSVKFIQSKSHCTMK